MKIHDLIVSRRESKGLSRRKLADLIGYTETTLRRIESGSTKRPSMDVIEALSAVLDIPIDQLLGREEPVAYAVGYDEVKRQALQLSLDDRKMLMKALIEDM